MKPITTSLEAIHKLRASINDLNNTLDQLVRIAMKDQATEINRPKILVIQQTVSNFYAVPVECMTIRARPAKWVGPRQVAMYLCRIHTIHSLGDIGRCFGGRDHGTVMHACNAVEAVRATDPVACLKIDECSAVVKTQIKKEEMPLFNQ